MSKIRYTINGNKVARKPKKKEQAYWYRVLSMKIHMAELK